MRTTLALLLTLAAACAKPTPTQCPGSNPGACVAGEVCTFDDKLGCRVCQCEPLDGDPGTPSPDDRSRPPERTGPDRW